MEFKFVLFHLSNCCPETQCCFVFEIISTLSTFGLVNLITWVTYLDQNELDAMLLLPCKARGMIRFAFGHFNVA